MPAIKSLIYSAILGFGLITIANPALASGSYRTIKVNNDRGGYVIKYALKVLKAKRSGKRVEIGGRCASACTLYLSMPQSKICLKKNASFAFHLPYGASRKGNRLAAAYMLRKYPGWVRSWISHRGGLSSRMITMSYGDASRFIPACRITRSV